MSDDIIWRKVKSYHELELPPDRHGGPPVQGFTFQARSTFIITNGRKNRYGLFAFDGGFQPTKDSEFLSRFIHVGTNDQILLSNWQLHQLQRDGRIRPVMGPDDSPKNVPGSSLNIAGEKRDKALRMMEYADAFEEYMREHDNWSLSDAQKAVIVAETADRIGDKNPPARSKWYELILTSRKGNQFDRLIDFVDNDAAKGNRSARYGTALNDAIKHAAHVAVANHGDWHSIRSNLVNWAKLGQDYDHLRDHILDENGVCKIPERKLQRVLENMNRYVHDFLRYGPEHAERVHKRTLKQIRPTAPLAIVDVDHSTLDVELIDDVYPIAYGRPDLVVFRDRCTAVKVGFAVAFGSPSYQTFLEGLKHMMFEKDPDLMNGCAYPWFGTPVTLGVDNAKHLVGLNIRAAAKEFGFRTVAYRPGHPWEKGALEVLFGILGRKLVHRSPGTTKSNPTERDKYDEDQELARPVLTVSEFMGFLNYYFSCIDHYKPTQGIAELATFSGVPAERWEDLIVDAPEAPLIDKDIFTRLGGDVGWVCIGTRGVRWEYVTYQCAELIVLTTNSKHKSNRKYEARRNPDDIGSIDVKDPYSKPERWISVPVCDADASYAVGLKLHVHRAIAKYKRDQDRKADREITLQDARAEMEASLVELHARRKKHGTAMKLARWYEGNVKKEERSRIVEMGRVEYSTGRMNLAATEERAPPPRISQRAVAVMPGERKTVDDRPKATATRTIDGEQIKPATFHHHDDGMPDDLADWDL
jgi:putative transposase